MIESSEIEKMSVIERLQAMGAQFYESGPVSPTQCGEENLRQLAA